MWFVELANIRKYFYEVAFFETIDPAYSDLPKRKELAESLGFEEGIDTHHFIKGETEIRLKWKTLSPMQMELYPLIRPEAKDMLNESIHVDEIYKLIKLLKHH